MKRHKILSFFSLRTLWDTPHFVFLVVMLLCGALAGSFTGLRSGQSEGALLEQLAGQMIAQVKELGSGGELCTKAVLGALGWQMAAVIGGAMRGHSLILSGICAARGFTMAFAAGAFLGTLHLRGLILAVLSGGVSGIITVPCLLLTASACFLAGQDTAKNKKGYWYALSRYRGAVLLCTFLSILGAMLRVPMLFLASFL